MAKMQASEIDTVHQAGSTCHRHDVFHNTSSQHTAEIFSIATPVVTNTLQLNENLNDTSFLQPSASSYHLKNDVPSQASTVLHQGQEFDRMSLMADSSLGKRSSIDTDKGSIEASDLSIEKITHDTGTSEAKQESQRISDDNKIGPTAQGQAEDFPKRKKNKVVKKNTKLDTKSKLEKSRQSARECRARKKLRYQYLEDLVCNREKAVQKLREELAMFCEMSKKIENGTISDSDRKSLIEQTKENNQAS